MKIAQKQCLNLLNTVSKQHQNHVKTVFKHCQNDIETTSKPHEKHHENINIASKRVKIALEPHENSVKIE